MKIKQLVLFVAFLLGTLSAFGQGVLIFDQQLSSNGSPVGGGGPITLEAPEGQAFTPTLSMVGFVRLWNEDLQPGHSQGATIYVNIRSNSITGSVLGTSDAINFPTFVNGNTNRGFFAFTNFIFSTPVAVTPGTQYVFEVVQASGSDWDIGGWAAYGYTGGDGIVRGLPETGQDLWFREGVIQAPEPASWALMSLGGGTLVLCQRKRRKRSGETAASSAR